MIQLKDTFDMLPLPTHLQSVEEQISSQDEPIDWIFVL
jgi:hypothetical protein